MRHGLGGAPQPRSGRANWQACAPVHVIGATTIAAGLHLQQRRDLVGRGRPSAVALVGADGALCEVRLVEDDDEILAVIPDGARVVVDAPLAVPNDAGSRQVERVLAWLDIAAFPTSRARLAKLHGGIRGEELRPALAARASDLAEGIPDATLRQILRERAHPDVSALQDLGEYRGSWLALRAPRYRPKGAGRAAPGGAQAAAEILAAEVDLGGWAPTAAPDDWRAIADAAVLDAVALAVTARRGADPARSLRVGDPERGEILLAADATMRARAAVNLARLREEREVDI
jgi:predicted nuclease with RNAse H fold